MELDIIWEETTVSPEKQASIMALLKEGISQALIIGGGSADAEVGLVLVSDETIKGYNKDYRGIDSPTDVLSFAMREKGEGEPDLLMEEYNDENLAEQMGKSSDEDYVIYEDEMLGDILISVERAQAQAKEYGHSLEREMVFLAVHGMLHLLGYDHEQEGDTLVMRQMEDQIMGKLGIVR